MHIWNANVKNVLSSETEPNDKNSIRFSRRERIELISRRMRKKRILGDEHWINPIRLCCWTSERVCDRSRERDVRHKKVWGNLPLLGICVSGDKGFSNSRFSKQRDSGIVICKDSRELTHLAHFPPANFFSSASLSQSTRISKSSYHCRSRFYAPEPLLAPNSLARTIPFSTSPTVNY